MKKMASGAATDSRLLAAADLFLEGCADLGLSGFLRAENGSPAAAPAAPAQEAPLPTPAPPAAKIPAKESEDPSTALSAIAKRAAACEQCELCKTRQQTVPGEGSPRARIMIVGEAPGADEDRSGRPFVGRAGQLLTKIIENGIGLARDEVFICNVLKCRPPGNRDPKPEEKASCTPFLEEQIEIIQPQLLLALGKHAANHLLDRQAPLTRLRGRLHDRPLGGPPVLVTYHPAYLLRNPSAKADCWTDIQIGMKHLGLPLPQQRKDPAAQAASGENPSRGA